jgi:hypothetical protein
MRLPLAVTRAGEESPMRAGYTRNISSGGVLFTAVDEPQRAGDPIEYVITLNGDAHRPVNIRCVGKVVRCEPEMPGDGSPFYHVAATMERYEFVRSE